MTPEIKAALAEVARERIDRMFAEDDRNATERTREADFHVEDEDDHA